MGYDILLTKLFTMGIYPGFRIKNIFQATYGHTMVDGQCVLPKRISGLLSLSCDNHSQTEKISTEQYENHISAHVHV